MSVSPAEIYDKQQAIARLERRLSAQRNHLDGLRQQRAELDVRKTNARRLGALGDHLQAARVLPLESEIAKLDRAIEQSLTAYNSLTAQIEEATSAPAPKRKGAAK